MRYLMLNTTVQEGPWRPNFCLQPPGFTGG